jgi:glycosyltransferase involved in cell wall biosynthesis
VHDYLLVMRGAERTFAAMADCWPDAPVYTSLYSESGTEGAFADRRVETSYLQRIGIDQKGFRRLLPLFPSAFERLRLSEYELVVSSSSAFAHGVRAAPDAMHVCYCHSPFRYAWHERDLALSEAHASLRPLLRRTLGRIRDWDRRASERVTHYIANSRIIQQRIGDYYGREATVIHPPVDTDRFRPADEPEDYLLVVCEVVRHKRVEVALEAARRAGRTIKVVGTGPDLERLRARYSHCADFLGRVPDPELTELYSRAGALVVPNVEEFGIAAVEAQAAGRPVVAVNAGGTKETVVDGETGVLVERGSVDELAEALREVDFSRFSSERIEQNAERFSRRRFETQLRGEVERLWQQHGGEAAHRNRARQQVNGASRPVREAT